MSPQPAPRQTASILSPLEESRIDALLAHQPTGAANSQAVCIDALLVIQAQRGWVSDACLEALAQRLGMHPVELDAVATFYNLIFRRPVGRHVILCCDSISCWVCGMAGIRERLEELLGVKSGETSADGEFTLLGIPCLGACDRAPALLIDRRLFGPVSPDRLQDILNSVRQGEDQWICP